MKVKPSSSKQGYLRVCYFGTYEKDYPGNRVLIDGLRKNGVEVTECHVPLWEVARNKTRSYYSAKSLVFHAIRYIGVCLRLLWKVRTVPQPDAIVVGFNGHLDVLLAKCVAMMRRCPLIINPMLSIYDTLVIDRGYFDKRGIAAKLILALEQLLMRLPDAIFLDTNEHYRFYNTVLGCPWSKFKQVFFGADDAIFTPLPSKEDNDIFRVLFYGKFQPLQGVPYIVKAAKLLEDDPAIRFTLIGSGHDSAKVKEMVAELRIRNVEFIEWAELHELKDYIASADVCLGIFGVTDKVRRCVANKVIQALAMAKPVITGDCAATRELIVDGEHALLCSLGSAEAIAETIVRLKNDPALCRKLSKNGLELFQRKCSPAAVGLQAKLHLVDVVSEYRNREKRCVRDPIV